MPVRAQKSNGDILGTVTDPSGAPVAGTKMNGHCTVSGKRSAIASNRPKRNAQSKTHPALRIIQGGGSCGIISDSSSIEPR